MTKPLFIIPDLRGGGAERVLLTILRHLDRSRFQPTLFLLKHSGTYWNEVPKDVRVVWALERGRIRNSPLAVLSSLVREAKAHDVVIGALELTTTYLAWLAASLARKPVVGWVHTDIVEFLARSSRWHRLTARRIYRLLDRVVFVSNGAFLSAVAFLGGRQGEGWQVIYNPLDWASYSPPRMNSIDGGRATPSEPIVISMGTLHDHKGFDILIRAHAILVRGGLRHQLMILGEGPARPEIEALVDDLGVRATVSLVGFVSEPFEYLKSGTVFASASRYEGFSMAILESLAAGLPVVATDCRSGPAEVLDQGRYGLLVPVDDADALAAAIKRLLCDVELRTRLSSTGICRARDFFPERTIPKWEALLLSACSRAEAAPVQPGVRGTSSEATGH